MANYSSLGDHFEVVGETSHGHLDQPEQWDCVANVPNVPLYLSEATNTYFQPAYNQNLNEYTIPPTIYQGMGSLVDNGVDAQLMAYIFRSLSGPQ